MLVGAGSALATLGSTSEAAVAVRPARSRMRRTGRPIVDLNMMPTSCGTVALGEDATAVGSRIAHTAGKLGQRPHRDQPKTEHAHARGRSHRVDGQASGERMTRRV